MGTWGGGGGLGLFEQGTNQVLLEMLSLQKQLAPPPPPRAPE